MWNRFFLKPQTLVRTIRRSYYQYKPKDKNTGHLKSSPKLDSEKAEKFASSDILLFRYENPRRILLYNLAGTAVFTMCSYQAYVLWKLKSDLVSPHREQFEKSEYSDKAWILNNVEYASPGISVVAFTFGASMAFYWLLRNLYLVRRLVLRKGGRHVTIVTYGITGVNSKTTTVPLTHVRIISFYFLATCSRLHYSIYGY